MAKNIDSIGSTLRETAFLGNNISNEGYHEDLLHLANIANADILRAVDQVAANKKAGEIISQLSKGAYTNADDCEKACATGDKKAQNIRGIVVDGMTLAMRDGGDPKFSDALNSGDVTKIDAVMPGKLKVWARDIRNRHIDEPGITAIIDQVQNNISGWMTHDEQVKAIQTAGQALEALPLPADDPQRILAREAIKVIFRERQMGPQPAGNGGGINATDLARAMDESQRRLAEQQARTSFVTFVKLIAKEEKSGSPVGQIFYSTPEFIGIEDYDGEIGLERWQAILKVAEAANNFTIYKRGAVKPEEVYGAPGPGAAELEKIHTNELSVLMSTELALREAARRIFRGLFEQDVGRFPAGNVRPEYTEHRRFFIRTKKKDEMEIDTGEYLLRVNDVATQLANEGIADKDMAKLFVSIGGHVFVDAAMAIDSADVNRENNNRTPDPVRVLVRPLWKAIQKAGFKADGSEVPSDKNYEVLGKVGAYLRNLVALDRVKGVRDFTKRLLRGDWQYIPDRTGVSWTEMTDLTFWKKDANGGPSRKVTMSVAQFLLEVNEEEIDTEHTKRILRADPTGTIPEKDRVVEDRPDAITIGRGDDDHVLGTYIRDIWPAMTLWGLAFKGKLGIKRQDELMPFLEDWTNKMQDLRKVGIPGYELRDWAAELGVDVTALTPEQRAEMPTLLNPWLENPESVLGGILNVLNMDLKIVDPPLLPGDMKYVAVRDMMGKLTGLSDKVKQGILKIIGYPDLGSMTKEAQAGKIFLAGLQKEDKDRRRRRHEAAKNEDLLGSKHK